MFPLYPQKTHITYRKKTEREKISIYIFSRVEIIENSGNIGNISF